MPLWRANILGNATRNLCIVRREVIGCDAAVARVQEMQKAAKAIQRWWRMKRVVSAVRRFMQARGYAGAGLPPSGALPSSSDACFHCLAVPGAAHVAAGWRPQHETAWPAR